ncbi:MAG: adenosine deaminase [Gordonia sp. (in: high G+C Gram-positive bacteria)]
MTSPEVTPRIDESWIRSLPKAEVHVHLEGSSSVADLLELARSAGAAIPFPAARLFAAATSGADGDDDTELSSFLRFLDWECGLVATAEQAARLAYRFAARASASGISYSDVIINPSHWAQWTQRIPALFDAFTAGFDDAAADGLAVVNICVSLLRTQTSSAATELVESIIDTRPRRVIALSIDGDEQRSGRVSANFADAFALARRAGLRRTVHAGESSGPEGVRDALDLLLAERIDHGVRAIEDPELIARLVDEQIPLGVCPRSNIALGLYPSWSQHPFRQLWDAGVSVTLNTDDPAILGTTLEADWALAASIWDLSPVDLCALARTSVTASFADDDLARDLIADIDAIAAGSIG